MSKGNWVSIAIYIVKMLIKWGPTLWELGKKIYDDIESKSKEDPQTTSEQKAIMFNKAAERAVIGKTGNQPSRKTLNALREDVWQYRNPGSARKPLSDARLRAVG